MEILVFCSFYAPELGAAPSRLHGHAREWARAGHTVRVVTNVPNSPGGRLYAGYRNRFYQVEKVDGVEVRRVWTLPSGKRHGKLRRGANYLVYLLMSVLGALRGPRPQVVVASAPYMAGFPGLVAALYHRAPLVYELRDPWIQVAVANGVIRARGLIHRALVASERLIAARASRVVVIGGEMATFMKGEMRLAETPSVVSNGVDLHPEATGTSEAAEVVGFPETGERFVVGFVGNFGSQYDLGVVLDAAEQLSSDPCAFVLLGEGKYKKEVQTEARNRRLENLFVCPAVPAHEVDGWLRKFDVTVVPMKPQPIFRVYLPMKVLHSLMVGAPVLFGGSGEVETLLRECAGGCVFPSGDSEALVGAIRTRMNDPEVLSRESKAGAAFVAERFARKTKAREYLRLLQEVAGEVAGGTDS